MELVLNLDELWTIQQLIRRAQGSPDYGECWGRDDMRLIQQGILGLTAEPVDNVGWGLPVTEGLLWQIEAQVPQSLDLGRTNMGRNILMKVFALLNKEEEDVLTPIGSPFVNAFGDDDPNDYDSDDAYPKPDTD